MRRVGPIGLGVVALAAVGVLVGGAFQEEGEVGALTFAATHLADTPDAAAGDGVCADGAGRCSLRAALDESSALGGQHTIVLSQGRHALTGPVPLEVSLTIEAAPGGGRPVVDLDGSSGFAPTLSMLSLSGIDIENGVSDLRGGSAIRAVDANLIIDDVVFRNHHSDGDGGAVNAGRGRLAVIESSFVGNSGVSGGAIAVIGTRVAITSGEFRDNGASSSGGAVATNDAEQLEILRNASGPVVFENNTALGQGGAVFVIGESRTGDRYRLAGAEFVGNSAGNEGGALFIGANRGANPPIAIGGSTFTDNIGVVGGAIGIDFAAVDVESSTFARNEARGGGGGAIGSGGTLEVSDSDFDDNTVDGDGGAIAANGPLVVVQSAFDGNTATEFGGAISTSGLVTPVLEQVSMNDNEAGASGGAMFHVGEPVDVSTVGGTGNTPDGPLVVEPDVGATDPGPPTTEPPATGPPPGPPASVSSVVPVSPARLVDTRGGQSTVDGQLEGIGPVAAGEVLRVPAHGRGGVPSSASAVVVNTVAVRPAGEGFLTLFPCDGERPSTSSVNFGARPTDVNNALVKLSADGDICVFSSRSTQIVMDVTAYSEGDEALAPQRIAESRRGLSTDDGQQAGFGRVDAGSVTEVRVAGRGGVPSGAAAVAVNVTVVRPALAGFVTLFPCDEAQPLASSLNFGPGDVRPNSSIVALSAGGSLCVYSSAATDLIVDVTASFDDVPSFSALNPARLTETRAGQSTVDGESEIGGRLAAGSITPVQVAGRGDVPRDAVAAAVNVAAVRPAGIGFVTLFPCDESQPLASSMNYVAGDVIANSGVVKLAADGSVCLYTSAETDLIMDVNAAWTE